MGRLILLDTSELLRPLPRKLHAAWAEIDGRKAAMPPTVGLELAPHGLLATTSDGMTTAERLLQRETPKLSTKRQLQLEIQAWWSDVWRNPESPYQLLEMNEALEDRVTELASAMDPKCFRGATPGYVADHHDARIVCESMVLGASLLLTIAKGSDRQDDRRSGADGQRKWRQAATLGATAGQRAEKSSEPGTPCGTHAGTIPESDDHERQEAPNLSASTRSCRSTNTCNRSGGGSGQEEAGRGHTVAVTARVETTMTTPASRDPRATVRCTIALSSGAGVELHAEARLS